MEAALDDSCRIMRASSLTTLVPKGVSFSGGIDQNVRNQIDGEPTKEKLIYEIEHCLFHATIVKNMKICSLALKQFLPVSLSLFPCHHGDREGHQAEIMKGECRWANDAFSLNSRQPN